MSTPVQVDKKPAADEEVSMAVKEPKQAAEKPASKGRKAKAPKEKKPKSAKKTTSHPPYFKMIEEALVALGEKSGSSPYAIAKYMEDKHRDVLPPNFKKILAIQLKNSAAKGKLTKIKASYKLSEKNKPKQVKAVKKREAPKKAVKKVVGKKLKKSTPAKPKSIKSTAAKKAKKA